MALDTLSNVNYIYNYDFPTPLASPYHYQIHIQFAKIIQTRVYDQNGGLDEQNV